MSTMLLTSCFLDVYCVTNMLFFRCLTNILFVDSSSSTAVGLVGFLDVYYVTNTLFFRCLLCY